ncbi:MAG: hypothetical protein ACKOCT_00930 [Alphaproteobacteria bacterium]
MTRTFERSLRDVATALLAAAVVVAGTVQPDSALAQAGTWNSDSQWPVAREGQNDLNPGVSRPGTLRLFRFNFDGTPMTEDRGNAVGWAAQAAKGNYVQNADKPTEEDTLELMDKNGAEIGE